MGIEHFKFWHWALLSVPIGLLGAWAMLANGPLGLQAAYATMGVDEFEARVLGRARWGVRAGPPLDVRAYPLADRTFLVTAYLPVGAAARDGRRQWFQRYRAHQITRAGTYVPLAAMPDPPQFRHGFDATDSQARDRAAGVAQTGWLRAGEAGYRDVAAGGATLTFPLRAGGRADRTLTVRVGPAVARRGGELGVVLNGHPLPPLTQDPGAPTHWRVAVPPAALAEGRQTLHFTLAGPSPTTAPAPPATPLPVGGIELIDPTYTIVDFLDDAKRINPTLVDRYAYQPLWEPRYAYAGWTLASLIVIGGIWPALIRLLIGAGFARAAPDPAYDLGRFNGAPERGNPANRKPTADDETKVAALAADLEAKLLADARARSEASAPDDAPAPEPVTPLMTAPVEVAVDNKPTDQMQYGGEYYPVVRKAEKPKS